MEKEIPMRHRSWKIFGAFLTLSLAAGFAADPKPAVGPEVGAGKAEAKAAPAQGAVGENAIAAGTTDDHCLKASADCPKAGGHGMKGHGKGAAAHAGASEAGAADAGADCPKHGDCHKNGQCLKHKGAGAAGAKASSAQDGTEGKPEAIPAGTGKTGSQKG